jgi:hypothetical protein
MEPEVKEGIGIASFVIFVLIGLITLGLWGCPRYKVYSARKEGEAVLAHASYSREVAVAEAKAKMESAALLAQAEVIRARGVDSAIKIISGSLQGNRAYIQWLWVNNMEKNDKTVIYIPSSNMGIPITEAGRISKTEEGGGVTSFHGQPGPITENK